ncbi:cytochrome P450 46A1 [Nemania serpens]|nr:cytochrome P450 46A1 [Nemania serpens]
MVQISILGAASLALVALALYTTKFIIWYRKARQQFPGPAVKSVWSGNLDEILKDDIHEKWRSWHNIHGPVFQTWNGPLSRTIYVGDPAMVAKIANCNWPKAPGQYEGFKPLSGSALFAQMDHQRWHVQRKALSPAFGPGVINGQVKSLNKYLKSYRDTLGRAAATGEVLDLSQLNVLLTLDFVGETAFGIDLNALEQGSSCRVLSLFEEILPELMKCGLFPLRAKVPLCASTRRMHAAIAELRGMARSAVSGVRARDGSSLLPIEKPGKRIFEILAQQRDSHGAYTFSTTELVDNYVTFLVAGGDPTAHTITFAIYELIRNPEYLARLRQELDAYIPSDAELPSVEQIKLPYLNMVLKETLRLHGPGFGTFRYCEKDTEVEGVVLPAMTPLALWNPQVHRDPNVWGPDAHLFKPERWADGVGAPQPGSFFPFSYGPRNCLGQGLAMLEMSLTLATLFRWYDFAFDQGFEMEFLPSFTMCAKNGLMLRIKERDSTI